MNYTAVLRYKTPKDVKIPAGKRRICVHVLPNFDQSLDRQGSMIWDIYARWAPPTLQELDAKFVHCGYIRSEGRMSSEFFENSLKLSLESFAPKNADIPLVDIMLNPMCNEDVIFYLGLLHHQIMAQAALNVYTPLLPNASIGNQDLQRKQASSNASSLSKVLNEASKRMREEKESEYYLNSGSSGPAAALRRSSLSPQLQRCLNSLPMRLPVLSIPRISKDAGIISMDRSVYFDEVDLPKLPLVSVVEPPPVPVVEPIPPSVPGSGVCGEGFSVQSLAQWSGISSMSDDDDWIGEMSAGPP
jgi:hypothetical protein